MAHDVFISYSAKDKAIADAVCATLEAKKIRCWIAPRDVLPGTPYGEALIDALNRSRVLVLVFSANSNESPQVMREVERAVTKGIPILPLRIENVIPSKALEYFVSSSHWLDALTPPLERHLQKLADSVHVLLGSTEQQLKTEPELTAPKLAPEAIFWNKVKPVYLVTGISAVVIIVIIVIVFAVMGGNNNKPLSNVPLSTTPGITSMPTQPSSPAKTAASDTTAATTKTTVPTTTATAKPTTTTPTTISPPLSLLFEDDFSNPDSGWQVRLDDVAEWGYENGEYSCIMKKQNWMTWEFNDNLDEFTDFILEVNATQISGPNETMAGFGVIFRALDSSNFYCFRISPNGRYKMEKRTNGEWETPLRDWTYSNLIKQGSNTNHIKIICKGSQIEAFINGYHIVTVTDNSYAQGYIGMTAGTSDTYNHVHFDNLKVFGFD